MKIRSTATLALVVLGLVASACTIQAGQQSSPATGTALSGGSTAPTTDEPVAQVIARSLPAVVNVTTDILTPQGQTGQGVGTGFIVRPDGIVVTNCHVVENGTKITVSTSAKSPQSYDAHVIGGDCEHDLAVLKIDGNDLPTVPLGNSSDLVLGQRVVAIGYALALQGGPTVTTGIVSALDRTVHVQDPNCTVCKNFSRTYGNVIQTDAAINHGNSGGPLLNMQGQVVGINSAGDDNAQNIGFAIAIDSAKDAVDQAISSPLAPTGYLGIQTADLTPGMAQQLGATAQNGAYVIGTTKGGPADEAGMKSGDVIVSVDGKTVASANDLGGILNGLQPGTAVPVVVDRGGQQVTLNVTLEARPLPTQLP
ncbi:MAG TPA: trypsin-like peptidase domain-containing protein [Actinomycetota bacterium]|jgi:serine protease Do|nr:trypsin-like peptidase domain-containing protein [Actinomycetota bacterium]